MGKRQSFFAAGKGNTVDPGGFLPYNGRAQATPANRERRMNHAENRMPSFQRQGLLGHGERSHKDWGQHLPVLHPQSPGRQSQAPGFGVRGRLPGLRPGAGALPHFGPRPLHLERLRRRRGPAHLRPGDHGRRPGPAGAHPRQPVQLPPRQPREAGAGSGHRADCGAPQRHFDAGAIHHGAAGDYGGQGLGGGPQL